FQQEPCGSDKLVRQRPRQKAGLFCWLPLRSVIRSEDDYSPGECSSLPLFPVDFMRVQDQNLLASQKGGSEMKKLLLVFFFFGSVPLFGQSAFDGTWRFSTQSAQFKGNDKFSLQNGMWHCDTCVPKEAVKADGKDQKVSGSPYHDAINVREVDDHTV